MFWWVNCKKFIIIFQYFYLFIRYYVTLSKAIHDKMQYEDSPIKTRLGSKILRFSSNSSQGTNVSKFLEWHWCFQLWANQLNVTTWHNMFLLLIERKSSFLCYTLLSLATKTYNFLWELRNREISMKVANVTERRKKKTERRIKKLIR